MSTLAFLAENYQMVVSVVLIVFVLGVFAWFFRNWKIAAAGVIVLIAFFGGQALWTAGYKARVSEDVAKETKVLRERIETMNKAAEDEQRRAAMDAAYIDQLEAKINETPPNSGACLDRDSARRLRDTR